MSYNFSIINLYSKTSNVISVYHILQKFTNRRAIYLALKGLLKHVDKYYSLARQSETQINTYEIQWYWNKHFGLSTLKDQICLYCQYMKGGIGHQISQTQQA